MPGGWMRRHPLDRISATTMDGFVAERSARGSAETITHGRTVAASTPRVLRRFVRMLILEREGERIAVITPPDHGTVAPNVVLVPEAPAEAAIVDTQAWEAL